jgi:hypothetical protein
MKPKNDRLRKVRGGKFKILEVQCTAIELHCLVNRELKRKFEKMLEDMDGILEVKAFKTDCGYKRNLLS